MDQAGPLRRSASCCESAAARVLGLCPGAGVEADGRGRGNVEGLRLAVDGNGDDGVGSAQRL